MPNFRELLRATKAQIREVTPDQAEQAQGAIFLDVREADEFDQGTIPGSIFLPRGNPNCRSKGRSRTRAPR
jgi:rhodanese-related sulfurtransferase